MKAGFHFSIAGGYARALEEARAMRASAVQIFAKSPRAWKRRALDAADLERFRALWPLVGEPPVFIHASYLQSLGAQDPDLFEKSVFSLADDLEKGRHLGAAGVVVHVRGDPERFGLGLERARRLAPSPTEVWVENTAQAPLEAVLPYLEAADGLVLDTAHAHLAGHAPEEAIAWLERLGLDRLKLIHFNDARHPRGSRRDVHASLGEGTLGKELKAYLAHPGLREKPFIMETPKKDDAKNWARFKAWWAESST